MEFFAKTNNHNLDEDSLKNRLTIAMLPALCSSIDSVILDGKNSGRIYCVWGEFDINREEIGHGIRFTLPRCPNALAWTITYDDDTSEIIIHCTINTEEPDTDFIDTIKQFVAGWQIN